MPIRLRWRRISLSGSGPCRPPPRMPILSSPIHTHPASGGESQFRQRSSVDLPDPEGPSTQTTSPRMTVRLTPSRMRFEPNDLTTFSALIATGFGVSIIGSFASWKGAQVSAPETLFPQAGRESDKRSHCPVDERYDEIDFERRIGSGDHFLRGEHELVHRNHREQRRVLDKADEQTRHGRQQKRQRLLHHAF